MGGLESNVDCSYIHLQVVCIVYVYHLYRKKLIESGMFLFVVFYSKSAVKMLLFYVCFSAISVQGCWLKLLNILTFLFLFYFFSRS